MSCQARYCTSAKIVGALRATHAWVAWCGNTITCQHKCQTSGKVCLKRTTTIWQPKIAEGTRWSTNQSRTVRSSWKVTQSLINYVGISFCMFSFLFDLIYCVVINLLTNMIWFLYNVLRLFVCRDSCFKKLAHYTNASATSPFVETRGLNERLTTIVPPTET